VVPALLHGAPVAGLTLGRQDRRNLLLIVHRLRAVDLDDGYGRHGLLLVPVTGRLLVCPERGSREENQQSDGSRSHRWVILVPRGAGAAVQANSVVTGFPSVSRTGRPSRSRSIWSGAMPRAW